MGFSESIPTTPAIGIVLGEDILNAQAGDILGVLGDMSVVLVGMLVVREDTAVVPVDTFRHGDTQNCIRADIYQVLGILQDIFQSPYIRKNIQIDI